MATTVAAIGTAILGAGASATAATITGGLVVAAASYGAASLASGGALGGDSGSINAPAPTPAPTPVSPMIDKTLPQQASVLEDPLVDDERESKKRRAASAKSRFKIDLKEPPKSGVNTPVVDKPTGLQI